MSTSVSLAQVTCQIDTLSVIKDVEDGIVESEDIWVSCYQNSKPSVHGKVQVVIDEETRDRCTFKGREGVICEQVSKTHFRISCPALDITSRSIRFPERAIHLPSQPSTKTSSKLDHEITSLDLSSDGQAWAVGLGNGSVAFGNKGVDTVVGVVHKAAVSDIRLVPNASGWSVLSASEDFTISLTSPPSTGHLLRLTGHTRAITSLCVFHIAGAPLQAISAGKDGTLRIWDINPGSGRQLGMVRSTGDVPINALSVVETDFGGLAAIALQSGQFDLIDLNTRTTVFSSTRPGFEHKKHGVLDAVALHSLSKAERTYILATGSRSGVLSIYTCSIRDGGLDVRQLGSCVRNGAGVSDIKLLQLTPGDVYPVALVSTIDGLPYQLGLVSVTDGIDFQIISEFSGGADCSPVKTIVGHVQTGMVWLAGEDGLVWLYGF